MFYLFYSMIPLLEKDGLLLAYIPCMLLFLLLAFSFHLDFKRKPTAIKLLVCVNVIVVDFGRLMRSRLISFIELIHYSFVYLVFLVHCV